MITPIKRKRMKKDTVVTPIKKERGKERKEQNKTRLLLLKRGKRKTRAYALEWENRKTRLRDGGWGGNPTGARDGGERSARQFAFCCLYVCTKSTIFVYLHHQKQLVINCFSTQTLLFDR